MDYIPGMDKKPEQRGRGRPTKPKNDKQAPISFRLTPRDRALIDHAATVAGVSRAEYIRDAAVITALRYLADQERKAARE